MIFSTLQPSPHRPPTQLDIRAMILSDWNFIVYNPEWRRAGPDQFRQEMPQDEWDGGRINKI